MKEQDFKSMYPKLGNDAPMEYIAFIKELEACILNEIKFSKRYTMLSLLGPTEVSKNLLTEFAADCMNQAQNLLNCHYMLTGKFFEPMIQEQPPINDYNNSLKISLFIESEDYKKYCEKYIKSANQDLKNVFFLIAVMKAQHSMRIPLLLAEK